MVHGVGAGHTQRGPAGGRARELFHSAGGSDGGVGVREGAPGAYAGGGGEEGGWDGGAVGCEVCAG